MAENDFKCSLGLSGFNLRSVAWMSEQWRPGLVFAEWGPLSVTDWHSCINTAMAGHTASGSTNEQESIVWGPCLPLRTALSRPGRWLFDSLFWNSKRTSVIDERKKSRGYTRRENTHLSHGYTASYYYSPWVEVACCMHKSDYINATETCEDHLNKTWLAQTRTGYV